MKILKGRTYTEDYYIKLLRKVLVDEDDVRAFVEHARSTYGEKDWWFLWLPMNEAQVKANIKEVQNALSSAHD